MKKIEVIKEQCISCGLCVNTPENETVKLFDWDEEGKATVVNQVIDENTEERVSICPTNAIVITETQE